MGSDIVLDARGFDRKERAEDAHRGDLRHASDQISRTKQHRVLSLIIWFHHAGPS